jgi:Holliday junction resolvase RusA-like endonuclease
MTRAGRVYYPKSYLDWRDSVRKHLKEGDTNLEGPVVVAVEQVRQAPKKSKLTHPPGDADNYLKAILDAITRAGGWWKDDVQVVYAITRKRWTQSGEDPHTAVEIYEIDEDTRP